MIVHAETNIDEEIARLFRLEDALGGVPGRFIDDAIGIAHEEAVREIPKRTGRTAGTIRRSSHRIPHGAEGSVYSTDDIAYYLEVGTRPHVIRPRPPRRALRFTKGSRVIFATHVDHPGTRAYHWLKKTQHTTSSPIAELFERKVEDVLRAL